jgi:hypothetical protein
MANNLPGDDGYLDPEDEAAYEAWERRWLQKNAEKFAKFRKLDLDRAVVVLKRFIWPRLEYALEKKHEDFLDAVRIIGNLAEENRRSKTEAMKEARQYLAKHAAEARHSKEGGSRSKRESIRQIWATGKYSSRDICAEQECLALGMSFSTARRALRGMPKPS